jgi:polyhydroxyalkanoate synthesis regulator phasin
MASLKHLSSRYTTNFARVGRLVGVCADLLRDVLDHFISVGSLFSELELVKDKLIKILKPQQKGLLYSKSKSYISYNELDISLLYVLLRNVCDENVHKLSNGRRGITSPQNGWGKRPPESDRSLAANIERIHAFRNEICHREEASLPDPEFDSLWGKLSIAIDEIEKYLGNKVHPTKYVDLLKVIKTTSMDPEETQKYIEELAKMKDEQKELEERLCQRIEEVRKDIVDKDLPRIVKSAG